MDTRLIFVLVILGCFVAFIGMRASKGVTEPAQSGASSGGSSGGKAARAGAGPASAKYAAREDFRQTIFGAGIHSSIVTSVMSQKVSIVLDDDSTSAVDLEKLICGGPALQHMLKGDL